MLAAIVDNFPLQNAIDRAESVRRFLDGRRPEQVAPSLDAVVAAAVRLGESLPDDWRRTFHQLMRGKDGWMTVREYEEERNAARRLFSTVREAMDGARRAAEASRDRTGREPAGLARLLAVLDDVGRLEDEVFRDWPSFAEPLPPPDLSKALTPEESLAEALGVSVEQARERLDARRRELGAQRRE